MPERKAPGVDTPQKVMDPMSCHCQAERGGPERRAELEDSPSSASWANPFSGNLTSPGALK